MPLSCPHINAHHRSHIPYDPHPLQRELTKKEEDTLYVTDLDITVIRFPLIIGR